MRPYLITGIGTAIIFCVVVGMWLGWGINTVDFTTALAVGLVLIIPFIWWWAYKNERSARLRSKSADGDYWQQLKRLKPKKVVSRHPTFSGKRQREDKWRFFPSNVE